MVGCARVDPLVPLNALANTSGLVVDKNRAYGSDPRQVLDVYAPLHARGAPVLIFIHGGSWTGGSKDGYKFVGESFARAGLVTVVMSYRLAPVNRYPSYVQDAASAIRWTRENAARFGGDPNTLFVSGHSAGGFNAVEVVVNRRWLQEVDVPVSSVKGVIGIAGPYSYDFRQFSSRNAFPKDAAPEDVMPSYHVRRDAPPHLLLVAEKDQVVGPENAVRMEAALRAAGVPVERRVLPKLDHYTIVGSLSRRLTFLGETRQAVLEFVNRLK
nr:alpha/beta hydrolase [Deinococcus yavapaiensis]